MAVIIGYMAEMKRKFLGFIPLRDKTLNPGYSQVISHKRGTRLTPPQNTVFFQKAPDMSEIRTYDLFAGHLRLVNKEPLSVEGDWRITGTRLGMNRVFTGTGPKTS